MRGRGNVPVGATAAAVGAALVFVLAFLVRATFGTAHHSTARRSALSNVEYLAQDSLDGEDDSRSDTMSAHVSFQNPKYTPPQDTPQSTKRPFDEKQRSRRILEDSLLEEGFQVDVILDKRDIPQATQKTEDLKGSLLDGKGEAKNNASPKQSHPAERRIKRAQYEHVSEDQSASAINLMKPFGKQKTDYNERSKTTARDGIDTQVYNQHNHNITQPQPQNISIGGFISEDENGTLVPTNHRIRKRRLETPKGASISALINQKETEHEATHSESKLQDLGTFVKHSSNGTVTQAPDYMFRAIKKILKRTEAEKVEAQTVLSDQRKIREDIANRFVWNLHGNEEAEEDSNFELHEVNDRTSAEPRFFHTQETAAESVLTRQPHPKFHSRTLQRGNKQFEGHLSPNTVEDLSDYPKLQLDPEQTRTELVLGDHGKVTHTARASRQPRGAGHSEEAKLDTAAQAGVGSVALAWWWRGSAKKDSDEAGAQEEATVGDDCPPMPPPELQVQRTPPLHSATAHVLRFLPQLMCGLRCDCFHVRWMLQAEDESAWAAGDAVWEAPWVALHGLRPDTLYAVAVWLRPHARAAQGDMRWFRALPARERTCPERVPRVRRLRARARPGGAQVEMRWAAPLPEGCRSALLLLARLATPRGVVRGAYDEGGGRENEQQAEEGSESEWNGPMPEWRLVGGYRVGGEPYGAVQECVDWPGQHCVELWRPPAAPRRMSLLAQVSVVRRGEEGDAGVGGWGNREAPPSAAAAQAWVEPIKEEGVEGDDPRWAFAPHPDTVSGDGSGAGGDGDVAGPGDAVGILLLLLAGMLLVMLLVSAAIAGCVYRRRRRLEERAAQLAAALAGDDGIISAWG